MDYLSIIIFLITWENEIGDSMDQKMNIYNIIGQNIKKYRKQKGLTQRQLADLNFLSDSFIAKLESTTYQTISIDTLEKIATSLNIEISKFFEK